MARKKKTKLEFLTPEQIKESLWSHGWVNNTLSPISTKPYWDITADVISADEVPLSGIFATNYAGSLVHKLITIIATEKHVYVITEIAGYVSSKILEYSDFMEVNLYQDQYLSSQIYIDIYLTRFRFYQLETQDPTSTLDFKKTIIQQQINRGIKRSLTQDQDKNMLQRTGLSVWRFFWRKVRFLLNIKADKKLKKLIKERQKQAAKNNKNVVDDKQDTIKNNDAHVESL